VIMPKMGDAMEEGTLLKWLKSEGEEVSEGDPIAEIETDMVTMELEAEDEGKLAQLIASEGQDVPVGEAIAFIQGEGEEVPERSDGGAGVAEEAEGAPEEAGAGTTTETREQVEKEEGRRAPETEDGVIMERDTMREPTAVAGESDVSAGDTRNARVKDHEEELLLEMAPDASVEATDDPATALFELETVRSFLADRSEIRELVIREFEEVKEARGSMEEREVLAKVAKIRAGILTLAELDQVQKQGPPALASFENELSRYLRITGFVG